MSRLTPPKAATPARYRRWPSRAKRGCEQPQPINPSFDRLVGARAAEPELRAQRRSLARQAHALVETRCRRLPPQSQAGRSDPVRRLSGRYHGNGLPQRAAPNGIRLCRQRERHVTLPQAALKCCIQIPTSRGSTVGGNTSACSACVAAVGLRNAMIRIVSQF